MATPVIPNTSIPELGVGTGLTASPSLQPYLPTGQQIEIAVYPGPSRQAAGQALHALVLPANVETLQAPHPMRTTLTQTITGAYIDNFGAGIPILQLSGHTGWQVWQSGPIPPGRYNGAPVNGFAAFQHLYYDIILYYFLLCSYQGSQQPNVRCEIVNAIDDNFWVVVPTGEFTPLRNKARPLLYQWSASFIVLQDLAHAIVFQPPIPNPIDPLVTTQGSGPPPPSPQYIGGSPPARDPSHAPAAQAQPPTTIAYTVQPGDTLWAIAQRFYGNGAQYRVIAQFNHLADPNLIFPGQVLHIPQGGF